MTFTVETPAALQTKAIADGMNVNQLIYEVWLTPTLGDLSKGAQKLYQEDKEMTVQNGENKTIITLDLVNDQKYTVLLWAQKDGTGVYDTDELNDVHYNSTEAGAYAANDERLAAFYGVAYVDDGKTVKIDGTEAPARVELRRPFAQVNLGTLNTSTEQGSTTGYIIDIKESNMILRNVPTHFNVVNGMATVPAEMEFLMYNAPCKDKAITDEDATLNGFDKYWYAGMNYVFASNEETGITAELEYNIKAKLDGVSEVVVNNTIPNVPLKENYRTNIVGNLLTSSTDYEVVIDARFNTPSEEVAVTEVTNNEDFQAAIKQDLEHIIIDLSANSAQTKALAEPVEYFIEVGANQSKYYLGGESTKSITINANGNKINFVQHNSDWNYVRLENPEAKLIINDALLTNSGKNTGHWKRNLIRFQGPVEFSNIVSDKGLCMMNDAVLNDIDITIADENYALWITAQGQTVNVDGLDVVATNKGRGIKIADEDYYEAVAESINLNVENAKFVTAKKAAVLVTSVAGADINWGEGNNINDVAADPINAVWVDLDREDSYDLVTVTGAIKVLEGSNDVPVVVTNADELKAAIKAAPANATEPTTIYLKAGRYTGCFDIEGSRNVILTSNEDAVIDGLVHGNSGNYITLKGLTLTNETPAKTATSRNNADGYCVGGYANCFHIEDCTFNVKSLGAINIYAAFNANKEEFELTVLNSTFNCNGFKSIRCKTNTKIDGCTFNDQERYSMQFQANSQAASEKVVFTNNTVKNPCLTSGQPFAAGVQISHSQLCEEVALTISGNTLESELFSDLKFAYDWEEGCTSCQNNMKITTCSLNGNQIVAGQCLPINDEAYEVLNEVAYTYDEATSTYTIYSARGLKWVADVVNATTPYSATLFDGKTVKLMNDIDLKNEEWIPIGDDRSQRTEFHGTFDGQSHTVKNIKITKKTDRDDENKSSYGLFGNLKGTVKNLTVENVSISGAPKFIGALVGRMNDGLIENCHVKESSVECNNWTIGGLVGQLNNGKISRCTVEGTTIKGYAAVGAIAGIALNKGERVIEDCSVKNCIIVQNGSFGYGNYDEMFGAIVGALYSGELTVNLNACSVENTTIKDVASTELCGFISEGDKLVVDGYEILAPGLGYNNTSKTYAVSSAEGLVAMSNTTIEGGESVILTADIDLTGVEFNGLNAFNPESKNTFNGQGHTVSNWTYTGGAADMAFIKNWVGTIENVTINGASLKTNGRSAVLAAKVYANIENCHVVESTIEDSYWACGVIAGLYNNGNIENCSVDRCYVKSNGGVGGIVGVINETAGERNIESCTVKNTTVCNTDIYGAEYSGALVAGLLNVANATINFNNCTLENNTKRGEYVGDLFYSAEGNNVFVDGVQQ